MEAQNLSFVQERDAIASNAPVSTTTLAPADSTSPRILCYPRPESLEVKLSLPHQLNLESPRALEIAISTGWNDIRQGELRLRSATAGLRLRTADATVADGSITITKGARPGVIDFATLAPGQTARIHVPYGLERDLPELLVNFSLWIIKSILTRYRSRLKLPTPLPRATSCVQLSRMSPLSCLSASMCKRSSSGTCKWP